VFGTVLYYFVTNFVLGEVSGSHGKEYEDFVFWTVAPSSLVHISHHTLIMEAVSSSETSVSTYQTTRRNIPGEPSYWSPRAPEISSIKLPVQYNVISVVRLMSLRTKDNRFLLTIEVLCSGGQQ
jgi:hypothetical protein